MHSILEGFHTGRELGVLPAQVCIFVAPSVFRD